MNVNRVDLLELDVDLRLGDLWTELDEFPDLADHLPAVSAFMRVAYARGYSAALVEPEPDRGLLFRDHGYRVPDRQAAA